MKKYLILLRHATAIDREDFDGDDYHRHLTKEGKKEAKHIGKILKKFKIQPSIILSSSADRCYETSFIVAKELQIKEKNINFTPSLYDENINHYLSELHKIPEEHTLVCICGHNPTISDLGKKLTNGESPIMDKGSISIIHFKKETKWIEIGKGRLDAYISPHIL